MKKNRRSIHLSELKMLQELREMDHNFKIDPLSEQHRAIGLF
jgi:hypothetical protein